MTTPSDPRLSRRRLLTAGAGFAVLGGLTACGSSNAAISNQALADRAVGPVAEQADREGPTQISGSFVSEKMAGRLTRWVVARPAGVTGTLPVVLVLHALQTNEQSMFTRLHMHTALQDYVDAGNPPFALACADIGENYYHLRPDGADGGAMLLDEFLPMLAADRELLLSTDRIGLFGWSMGGFGALRLASILGAPKVAAVAVSSPALWGDPHNFPARAFDSLADYRAKSLFGQQDRFSQIPLLISIGSSDQFFTYTRQWAAELQPPAAFGTSAGGHTNEFWRSVLPGQIAFLGRELGG